MFENTIRTSTLFPSISTYTYHVSQTQSGKEVEIFDYRILFTHPYDRKNARIFATLLLKVSYLNGMCVIHGNKDEILSKII